MRTTLAIRGLSLASMTLGVTAATAAAGGGGGCHGTEGTGDVVELRVNCFTPGVLHLDDAGEVTFVNRDGVTHDVNGARIGFSQLLAGDEVTLGFDEPGIYSYACSLHPMMTGAVVVGGGGGGGGAEHAVAAAPVAAADDDDGWAAPTVAAGIGGVVVGVVLGRLRRRHGTEPAPTM